MNDLDVIAAFDVASDGAAVAVEGDLATLPAAGWRWVHLDLATDGLEEWLLGQLDPILAAALLAPETRPRCDMHNGGLILTLRGVNLNPGADAEDMVSVRVWATDRQVITIRRRKLMALDQIRQDAVKGRAPATTGAFIAALTEGLGRRIETVAGTYEDAVDALEEQLIADEVIEATACLTMRQKLIKLRRFVGPQRDALEELAAHGGTIEPQDQVHLREIANKASRTVEAIDATRDRMIVLQDHIDAKTAMELGRNSYILSVMAAIFLPLGFLTGLFGVNVAGMPGIEWPMAFAVLSGASFGIGLLLFLIFRWKKWL